MYAIVNISGKQFKVQAGDQLMVPHQNVEPGKKVVYDRVLLLDTGKTVKVGTPVVKGSTVEATVVEHNRTEKIPVFKKKRRKGYRVKNTHRQEFTTIKVESVKEKVASKKKGATTKKSPPKKSEATAGD